MDKVIYTITKNELSKKHATYIYSNLIVEIKYLVFQHNTNNNKKLQSKKELKFFLKERDNFFLALSLSFVFASKYSSSKKTTMSNQKKI